MNTASSDNFSIKGVGNSPDYRNILDGEVYVVSEFPNKESLHKEVMAGFVRAVERTAGPSAAESVRREGVERVHEFLQAANLRKVVDAFTDDSLVSYALYRFAAEFAKGVLGVESDVWIDTSIVLRIFPPQATALARSAELQAHAGILDVHNPHIDSWFAHSPRGINLWYSIGNVTVDNGLIIYKGVYGRPLRNENRYLARGQKIGYPYVYGTSPGSVVAFAGEQLHASHINVTGDSRVVVSVRFSLDRPSLALRSKGTDWYRGSTILRGDPQFVQGGLQRMPIRHYRKLYRYLAHAYRVQLLKVRAHFERQKARAQGAFNMESSAPHIDTLIALGPVINFPPKSSESIQTSHGMFSVFNRDGTFFITDDRCPHRGASLADGWCEGQLVTCPWHGLKFNLSTGVCVNFSSMRIRAYQPVIKDGTLFVGPQIQ